MTEENEKPTVVRKLVVVFDISSSTTILEELRLNEHLHVWRNMLIEIKKFLQEQPNIDIEIYKFLGDGWVLLFSPDVNPSELFQFLHLLTSRYFYLYCTMVTPFMQKDPRPVGLTLGIDSGDLIRLTMNEQAEYLGRAINVAARLQGEAKHKAEDGFTNLALVSKATFHGLCPPGKNDWGATQTIANLRNISGGEFFQCFEIHLST